jgi:hypothetical protein
MTKDEIKTGLKYFIKVGEGIMKYFASIKTKVEYDILLDRYNAFYKPSLYLLNSLTDQTLLEKFEFNQQLYNPDLGNQMYIGGDRRRHLTMIEDIELIKANLVEQIKLLNTVHSELLPNMSSITEMFRPGRCSKKVTRRGRCFLPPTTRTKDTQPQKFKTILLY